MKMLYLYTFSFVFSASIFLSCKATHIPASSTASIQPVPIQKNKGDSQLMFLVFKIRKSAPQNAVELLSRNRVEGTIKGKSEGKFGESNLGIFQVSGNQEILDSLFIEHPLYKHVEHYDEKELHSQYVELDSAEFFVRLRFHEKATNIHIVEYNKNTKKELNIIKL